MIYEARRSNRMGGYSYSTQGLYFITINAERCKAIFGRVINENDAYIVLTNVGENVKQQLEFMKDFYNDIKMLSYVIMPNHVHMILYIPPKDKEVNVTDRANELVPRFISTLKRFVNKKSGKNVWHRSYFDRVIRNEEEYFRISEYIRDNPRKWAEDKLYI